MIFRDALKSVAGNIGAIHLQQLAAGIEVSIKEHHPRAEIDALLDVMKKQLDYFISQLEQNLPEEQARTSVVLDQKKLKEACDHLKMLLANDDAEAVDVLDANADLLNTAFPNHYRKIAEDIHSFNFEAALTLLRYATGTPT